MLPRGVKRLYYSKTTTRHMKKFFPHSIVLLCLAAASALGQDARSTPTPTPADDVVKISTNLIQLDVSVTDAKGKSITDLKPGEIELYENGKRQKISNFSFVSGGERVVMTDVERKAKRDEVQLFRQARFGRRTSAGPSPSSSMT